MSFDNAYKKTSGNEGGYTNNAADKGGETFAGIARNYHPGWSGWTLIDSYKKKYSGNGLNKALFADVTVMTKVKNFYRLNFWDKARLDRIDTLSPSIAEKMYDIGVNMGISRPAKWLQQGLNLLNKNGKVYANIAEDGAIGAKTISALESCIKTGSESRLLTILKILQGSFYIKRMTESPSQRIFIGWFDRVGM